MIQLLYLVYYDPMFLKLINQMNVHVGLGETIIKIDNNVTNFKIKRVLSNIMRCIITQRIFVKYFTFALNCTMFNIKCYNSIQENNLAVYKII